MKIAQVAPLTEAVPPHLYGGTERVVAFLTDELVRCGHDVTLFASGDSRTSAHLVASWPRALRLDGACDGLSPHILMLEEVLHRASDFDVIHFHIAQFHFPSARRLAVPHVTTLHGRLDIAQFAPLYREFNDIPVVSISDAQRDPLPEARWVATVHHGLPERPAGISSGTRPLSRLHRPHLSGEAGRSRHRHCHRLRCAVTNCRQGGSGGPHLLRERDPPSARQPAGGVHRRNRRIAEGRVPRRRLGAALSD